MKKIVIPLLGTIFVLLLAGSVESVAADHLEPGEGIFIDENRVNLVSTKDSKYHVHLQVEVRNAQGQLISISETVNVNHIPHGITDNTFDTLMGEKEIVTIDNIKYEKVQYSYTPSLEQRYIGLYPIYTEIALEFTYEEGTLAKMQRDKDYSLWKIHHCATFKGHNYDCIPVFQVLVPTMTLQPGDVLTQQWTILRALN